VREAEEIPLFFTLIPVLALLSNYDRENCLINVGTEGVVGNGYSVRVTAQIAQRMFGPAERALGIDHPIGAEQRAEHGGERLRRLEGRKAAVKPELARGVEFAETRHKLPAEHAAEHLDGQEEVMPPCNPARVIRCQSAGRNDAVDMRVEQQLLIPGVQHAEEPDLGAQVFRIAGDLEQRLGAGAEFLRPT
jgi:hypothetical protein